MHDTVNMACASMPWVVYDYQVKKVISWVNLVVFYGSHVETSVFCPLTLGRANPFLGNGLSVMCGVWCARGAALHVKSVSSRKEEIPASGPRFYRSCGGASAQARNGGNEARQPTSSDAPPEARSTCTLLDWANPVERTPQEAHWWCWPHLPRSQTPRIKLRQQVSTSHDSGFWNAVFQKRDVKGIPRPLSPGADRALRRAYAASQ